MRIPDTRVEIDLSRIAHNTKMLRKITLPRARLMAVVKADAYGHGAAAVAGCAIQYGADTLGVARIREAAALREAGLTAPILVFGHTPPEITEQLIHHELIQTVFATRDAYAYDRAAGLLGKKLPVHLKIDTGMGRLGFCGIASRRDMEGRRTIQDLLGAIETIARLPHLVLDGMYTHFAAADEADKTSALGQLEYFTTLIRALEGRAIEIPVKHAANSAAILDLPQSHLDMVRAGIALYGLYPSDQVNRQTVSLLPAMAFKSRIIQVKKVPAGFRVSYGGDYSAPAATSIATVPVGYADGLNRRLSSRGVMLVHGRRAPIAGRVCMDLTMLDVGQIPDVAPGDEVVIFGRQGEAFISADEVAASLNTINYEIVSTIAQRVPRVYQDP
ncbi:MAG: alanine racemase [Thermodesulfobacteriota bacterium]